MTGVQTCALPIYPSTGGRSITLTGLEIAGDEGTVDAYLGASARQPLEGVDVTWLEPSEDDRGVVAATFATPSGDVRID